MDILDFLNMVNDILAECETEEEIETRKLQMSQLLLKQANLSKKYLEYYKAKGER